MDRWQSMIDELTNEGIMEKDVVAAKELFTLQLIK